ncbi:MAG: radical SAM protein [Lysobacterales bacterium]|nr:MAG: radical SAM protein [Xanthomonadales bacterium]
MRIALVSANREKLPDAVVPLGLLYVLASVESRHDCQLWDICFEPDQCAAVRTRIAEHDPQIIAIGLRNIQSADYSGCSENIAYYRELIRTIRECSRATIVLGGGGLSVMPRELVLDLRPDYAISGEAERAFAELVVALERGGSGLSEIGNLHFFDGDDLVSTPAPSMYQNIDNIPPPDKRYVDNRYYAESGIDSIQTKRGCPLHCDYCTYPLIEGRSIRQRDPVRVLAEMFEALDRRPEICHFFIVDSVFNLPPAHAKAVCREMIRRSWRTPWTCYANPIGFDRELAELMAAAGCAGLEIGSDSGVNAVLDRLKKGFRVDRIRDIRDHCSAAGVPDCHSFILGTQGESMGDVERTLEFCAELDPFAAIIGVWTDDYEALDPELAAARQRFRDQVIEVVARRSTAFSRWIIPSIGINFDARLFRLLRRKGLKGPLWQHINLRPALAPGRSGTIAQGKPASRGGQ